MKIAGLKIKGVTSNSKAVKKDFVFVAIKGNRQDGNLFIREAVKRGAAIVVVEKSPLKINLPDKVTLLEVDDCRKFLGEAAHKFYGCPSDKIKVVGITGTNGKTTISYLIEALANKSGAACGVIGTINYRFKNKVIAATNTTPGAGLLQRLLSKMVTQKVKYCAMEVSSHALDQDRVWGINFSSGIFTNLTQDHLDYHKNLENYFLAKSRLFRILPKQSFAIINNDDLYGGRLRKLTKARVLTYGIDKKSDVMAKDIRFSSRATEFSLCFAGKNIKIKTILAGRYNIYNILAAAAWALSQNLSAAVIKKTIADFKNVPGRLERVAQAKGRDIFIDYAHTPDALFNVLKTLRPLCKGKMVVVFGCGGERDKLKRPLMGKIATELADLAIITSDNPRSEDPGQIINDIEQGIKKNNYLLFTDRAEAIRKAVALVCPQDCLLIAGKGHEDYQVLKNKIQKFSDRKAVEKCLKSMK
jgi:UDP-N-acetylmuramoyl-L-alanyl-D-glutamate--2,6-diaminopimelate ligase